MFNVTYVDILRYYMVWNDKESLIYENVINNSDYEKKLMYFKKYLNYMRMTRNFKKDKISEILMITINQNLGFDPKAINELSNSFFNNQLLAKNNRYAFVAASKILWLFNREFVIYDNYNRRLLEKVAHEKILDYEKYFTLWNYYFNESSSKIIENSKELYKIIKDKVLLESWFYKRVFDLKLWQENQKP